ncbi:hypothetical protein FGO68_gene577 [Halteria grandinella]|uniref:Uncharacterized protein n=1 Tax=Halteria grandinella TaxID=5974 RepID=A0A8J8SZX4_HALGN|nr:hypothetical protein FGO68_gene577 [Halteria grandinella]
MKIQTKYSHIVNEFLSSRNILILRGIIFIIVVQNRDLALQYSFKYYNTIYASLSTMSQCREATSSGQRIWNYTSRVDLTSGQSLCDVIKALFIYFHE